MQVIYVDTLFLLNLLTDYLLCLTAGRLCGLTLRRGRYLAAAALGAAYAAAVLLPGLRALAGPAGRLGTGVLMGLTAFGRERQPLRCTAVLLLTACAFGGAIWALNGGGAGGVPALSLSALALCFALCYGLLRLLLRCRNLLSARRFVEVRAVLLGREARFSALRDTGNELSDPLTGRHVLVASPEALRPILRENTPLFEQLGAVELMEASARIPELRGRLRLLSCSNLSGSALLPVLRPERLLLDGEPEDGLLIAVSPRAAGEGFEAIL